MWMTPPYVADGFTATSPAVHGMGADEPPWSALVQVNLNTNTTNCGACGTTCSTRPNAEPATCINGVCAPMKCLAGFADCNSNVADGCEVRQAASSAQLLLGMA
jgi:hypothetical protein